VGKREAADKLLKVADKIVKWQIKCPKRQINSSFLKKGN
jgi:hypothetical protein